MAAANSSLFTLHSSLKRNLQSILITLLCSAVSCASHNDDIANGQDGPLPDSPEYTDASQWYVTDRNSDVDLFYIASTETSDYTLPDGTECHYADTYRDSLRTPILSEMQGVDELLGAQFNFYSPFYRQCTIQSFVNDSLINVRLALPVEDIRKAFSHYLATENKGRPFILVGFSQGAMIVLRLLSEMDDDTYSRMVAAYVIGASIPQAMLDNPRIKPAQRADDTGVTICYNSARDASCLLWPRSAVCINPVNWRTDTTPATLVTEPSPLIPLDRQQKDNMTVTLDPVSNLLIVSGYTATDYILPVIGKDGNYHSREIWLYREQLRENMNLRAAM